MLPLWHYLDIDILLHASGYFKGYFLNFARICFFKSSNTNFFQIDQPVVAVIPSATIPQCGQKTQQARKHATKIIWPKYRRFVVAMIKYDPTIQEKVVPRCLNQENGAQCLQSFVLLRKEHGGIIYTSCNLIPVV